MGYSQIGLDFLHYAILTQDNSSGVAYQTPVHVPNVMKIGVDPSGSVDVQYADDGPAETVSQTGAVKVNISLKDLPLEDQAAFLGHAIVGGVMVQKTTDIPPEVAMLFRSRKTNGHYRYIKLLKGRFAVPKTDYETKGEKAAFQNPSIEGTFLRRNYDNEYQKIGDADAAGWVESTGTTWFDAVESAPSALTLATVPADAAENVAINASPSFTFNNAIDITQVTADYFYLLKTADGSKVAAALSYDSAHKVITLNPTADLTNAADYLLVTSGLVKDIYGQTLAAGTTIANFTTVAG